MRVGVHLTFNGDCEAAFKFYQRTLGATIVSLLAHRDAPGAAEVPPEWRDKIVHGSFTLGDQTIAGADVRPQEYEKPRGFYLLLDVAAADADRVFRELSEGGVVHLPLQKTFWSTAFGVLVDRFGVPWEVNGIG